MVKLGVGVYCLFVGYGYDFLVMARYKQKNAKKITACKFILTFSIFYFLNIYDFS